MNFGEYDWKFVKLGDGLKSVTLHALKYLVLPLLIVTILYAMTSQIEDASGFSDLFLQMRALVLLFGITLAALGFFKGAYPKGTYARLTFALAIAILAIFYAWSLLLDGRLQTEIADKMFELDIEQLFLLYLIGALFSLFMQLGEFIDHRRAWWERGKQVEPREKEDIKDHRWHHDFRLRYGSLSNGLKLSKSALFKYTIIPLAVIILIKAGLSSLEIDEIDDLVQSLDDVYYSALLLGIAIAALSFFKGFYPKGSFSRFIPAMAVVLLSMYWTWIVGLEGVFMMEGADVLTFTLDYTGILLLMVCATGLWGVYYAVELWVYRREWKEGGFKKDAFEGERKKDRKEKKRKVKKDKGPAPSEEEVRP